MKKLLRLGLGDESVADPRFRHDVARRGWVGLDLLAQGAHMHAYRVGRRAWSSAPDARDDLFDEHRFACVRSKKLEQRIFRRSETDLARTLHDAAAFEIDREVLEAKRRRSRRGGASQLRSNAREQL